MCSPMPKSTSPAAADKKPAAAKKPAAGFAKPVQPDDALAAVVGSNPLPRTELTKKLWEYIRAHFGSSRTRPKRRRSTPTTS